jgi:hypothetical protein
VRRALALVAALTVLLAGCGGGDKQTTTAARTTTTAKPPPVPALTREEAVSQIQSNASQEAFKRDFSFAATDISATCEPAPRANGKPSFACRYTTPKGSCKGKAQVVRLAAGDDGVRNFTMKCKGAPNIGPDTSDPNFNPGG